MGAAAMQLSHQVATRDQDAIQGWRVSCRPFVYWLALAVLLGVLALPQTGQAADTAPLYQYELGSALTASELGTLAPLLPSGVQVHSAQVRVAGQARKLADLKLAQTDQGKVLLDWQAHVDDPFLALTPPLVETTALASVLKRHVPTDAVLLAWWDVSRQFELLGGVNAVFSQPLGVPLFVPTRWHQQVDAARAIEQAFWQDPTTSDLQATQERFDRFANALLAPEQDGVAALRELGGGQSLVLVLHVRDLILLGQMAPDKLGVAFRDFGLLSEVHGMIQRVRSWMRDNKYTGYGLLQSGSDPVRAVALTDEASSQTLVARLLPLIGNDQSDVDGTRLVYRTGGFIVFEITAGPVSHSGGAN